MIDNKLASGRQPMAKPVKMTVATQSMDDRISVIDLTFSKYTESGPAVFEDQMSPRMVVMPMQVAWGDETPPAAEAEPQVEATNEASNTDKSESSTEEETAEQETIAEEPVTK